VWESNPPLRLERAGSSPIDERADFAIEWVGGRSNPRLRCFKPPLGRLSYRPVSFPRDPNDKARWLGDTGPDDSTGDRSRQGVTGDGGGTGAGTPLDRRIAPFPGHPVQDSDASRSSRCNLIPGCLEPTRQRVHLSIPAPVALFTLTDARPVGDVRASPRFSENARVGHPRLLSGGAWRRAGVRFHGPISPFFLRQGEDGRVQWNAKACETRA
jgi:hypothetical protein